MLPNPDSDPVSALLPLEEVFKTNGVAIQTYEDYHKLPYTQAVFYETMRCAAPTRSPPSLPHQDTDLFSQALPASALHPQDGCH